MAKSKALRKERQPGGDDFSLQSKRRLSQRAVRVSSRSCSPEQSPSPSHNKHHSKVTLADFVNLSSESRVLSSQRGIAMASLNPSASSPCSADFVCNSDQQRKRRGKAISQHAASPPAPSQYHPSLSCPTERVPYPPTTSTHCPGYGSASPTGVVTDVLGSGPYAIFCRPLVLQIMPEFFDFQFAEITSMPTWVRFPNLLLRCWNNICLSKIASMVGKPIHCDSPTAQMSRISYARVLIDIDLFTELKTSVNVMLPNGTLLVQNLVYESLPRFCKHCKSLGHSTLTCKKGHTRTRKRPHAASTCATSSGSSADTAVVEKQSPYCPGPSCIYREDPMSSEVAVMDLQPSSSQPPNCKRTKAGKAEMVAFGQTPSSHLIPRRQYFTRSKAAASSYEGPTSDSFQSL
ncbi:uncharacterized protein [Populus alba]|uniref:uncharacterized protein n=1 Tax=Populus alba TaxID=43335 RepID=UPI00158C74BD|nr:uncharacterized protein LOC118032767 [Populus alba]